MAQDVPGTPVATRGSRDKDTNSEGYLADGRLHSFLNIAQQGQARKAARQNSRLNRLQGHNPFSLLVYSHVVFVQTLLVLKVARVYNLRNRQIRT